MPAVPQEIRARHHEVRPARLTVLIADDHPLIIAGIRRTIEHLDDMQVVGEAHSGPELTRLIERRRPDVVVMDLRMPGVSGTEMIKLIRRRWPQIKTIVLSACDDRATVDAALRAGASAYLPKSSRTIDLASVLHQAASGAVVHAPAAVPAQPAAADAPGPPSLTDRERSILSAVATGMTTAAISRDLWISEHTIKFHLTSIYRKLGVPNRAGAVRYALEHGFA
ncbi:MAG TPA: response regulator transcription factor [Solirubrobacteraceae bacterium]|jgi:DNA-binding NarL/FixJ family response regulator|nr:response regulator transcription factor [Solirubrobacteraceae bacterium]